MSALAVVLRGYGCVVSGCDVANATVLAQLGERDVAVSSRHDVSHLHDVDVVLWSPAVRDGHPELVAARASGLVTMTRARALGELSRMSRVVGVTGTHGKTTATSMLVHIMTAAGRDDSRLVGADVRGVGFGGHYGAGDLLMEVDESYGAFAEIAPYALGLLNVEPDHLDHYATRENLESAFVNVLERTTGPVVVWRDDPGAARVAARMRRPWQSVGSTDESQWVLRDVELSRDGSRARLVGSLEVAIDLRVTGRHNVINAAVVAVLALSTGVSVEDVQTGLSNFRGAPRRFERVARWGPIDVIDDYAHLPGEIAATVAAARAAGYEKIVAIFQPHRVTRTISVGDAFAPAFDDVDDVIVTDIYSAGEDNPEAITGEVVAKYVRDRGRTRAHYAATLADAAAALSTRVGGVDLVLLLGAGDVHRVVAHLTGDAPPRRLDERSSPAPRGVVYDAPLGAHTTYRVGGSVAALVTCARDEDLDRLMAQTRGESACVVIGNGSNVLVADGWHDLVAVHLTGDFASLRYHDDDDGGVVVVAGAGLDLPVAARRLAADGVVGFEWAVGVPGTFGGAVAMNAGGHGSDMGASVTRVEVWTQGSRRWREADEMDFSYRSSALSPGQIATRVELRLRRGDSRAARARITEIVRWRREHQPGGANAGSVFRNPPGDVAGRLIESVGMRGFRQGAVMVSDKHANFIIADPGATATEIVALMRLVRTRVGEATGVWLESEHRFVGFREIW